MLVWTRDAVVKFEVLERIVVTDNTGQGHRRSILSIWMSHSEKKGIAYFHRPCGFTFVFLAL